MPRAPHAPRVSSHAPEFDRFSGALLYVGSDEREPRPSCRETYSFLYRFLQNRAKNENSACGTRTLAEEAGPGGTASQQSTWTYQRLPPIRPSDTLYIAVIISKNTASVK